MQNLYIRLNPFSIKNRYEILDEWQNTVYFCRGEWFSLSKTLRVRDRLDCEVMTICRRGGIHLSRYEAELPEGLSIAILRERSFLHPEYRVEGLDWKISGDYFHHEYIVCEDDKEIGKITKARADRKSQYKVEICEEEDVLPVLAIVLTIDSSIAEARMIAGSAASV